MDELDLQTALALLRTIPGEARVVPMVSGDRAGLIIQFESGIEIHWAPDSETVAIGEGVEAMKPKWGFHLRASDRLAEDWRKWREDRASP